MRISSKPAKRDGWPKKLFDERLTRESIQFDPDGVTLTLVVKDIYSKGSNQRYSIRLTEDDLATILDCLPETFKVQAA
jgi:hypothetical protein